VRIVRAVLKGCRQQRNSNRQGQQSEGTRRAWARAAEEAERRAWARKGRGGPGAGSRGRRSEGRSSCWGVEVVIVDAQSKLVLVPGV
jgi:hypothetical protein